MNIPTFSVVIPVYNSSKTIRRTLRSLERQTYKNFEVVIVDDYSADYDKLKQEIDRFVGQGIRVLLKRHSVNKNGAAARNTGIKNATGLYIAFLDSDDSWSPFKLQIFKQAIERIGDSAERYVFFSDVNVINETGQSTVRPRRSPKHLQSADRYLFVEGGFIQTSSIVVAKNLALSVLFNEKFCRHQDFDFVIRAVHSGALLERINIPLTNYFIVGGMYNSKPESADWCLNWLKEMRPFLTDEGYYGYRIFNLTMRYLKSKKIALAIFNIVYSISTCPIQLFWQVRFRFVDAYLNFSAMKQK